AVAVRARDEEPVQGGDEHGPLESEREGARCREILEYGPDPKPLPQAPKQKRSADALAREAGGLLWIVQGREEHDLLAEASAGGQQCGKPPAGCEFVDAADGGDDVLAHGTAVASVLDNLEVAARSRLLQAKEAHGTAVASVLD